MWQAWSEIINADEVRLASGSVPDPVRLTVRSAAFPLSRLDTALWNAATDDIRQGLGASMFSLHSACHPLLLISYVHVAAGLGYIPYATDFIGIASDVNAATHVLRRWNLEYSLDEGRTWQTLVNTLTFGPAHMSRGQSLNRTVLLRAGPGGNMGMIGYPLFSGSFVHVDVSGDLTSLLDSQRTVLDLRPYSPAAFACLFGGYDQTAVHVDGGQTNTTPAMTVGVAGLRMPSIVLGQKSYWNMFRSSLFALGIPTGNADKRHYPRLPLTRTTTEGVPGYGVHMFFSGHSSSEPMPHFMDGRCMRPRPVGYPYRVPAYAAFRECFGTPVTNATYDVPAKYRDDADCHGALSGLACGDSLYNPPVTLLGPPAQRSLCLSASLPDSSVSMVHGDSAPVVSLVYSTDGRTWKDFVPGTTIVRLPEPGDCVWISAGDSGNHVLAYGGSVTNGSMPYCNVFQFSGAVHASGDVTALLDSRAPVESLADRPFCLAGLFADCDGLVGAWEMTLPSTTLGRFCYARMFANTSIQLPPTMLATRLARGCCEQMFLGCRKLKYAPYLRAQEMLSDCYHSMFQDCDSLYMVRTCQTSFSGCTDWLRHVANPLPEPGFTIAGDPDVHNGTVFACPASLASLAGPPDDASRGNSSVPAGWMVTGDPVIFNESHLAYPYIQDCYPGLV